jgi:hypothetical protein
MSHPWIPTDCKIHHDHIFHVFHMASPESDKAYRLKIWCLRGLEMAGLSMGMSQGCNRAVYTSECDDGASRRQNGPQRFHFECSLVPLFGYAVKYGAEKDVVKSFHILLHLLEGVERSGRGLYGVYPDWQSWPAAGSEVPALKLVTFRSLSPSHSALQAQTDPCHLHSAPT